MADESQLDEMRSAIRGDFERLAERRGEQELVRVGEPETAEHVAVGDGPAPMETQNSPDELGQAEELAVVDEEQWAVGRASDGHEDERDSPRRSWLARLFEP